jgi:hypothetical protein
LATLVRNTSDENEMRIIYEYLSEASTVFPKVFPVIHNLLDAKINSVLSLSHDESILLSVQSIIYQMIVCSAGDDATQQQQQLSYLQSFGFGGLWRFAGPFTVSRQNPDNVELFVNCLEAMVETCLPSLDDHDDGSEHSIGLGSCLMGTYGSRHTSSHHHRHHRALRHHLPYCSSSNGACLNPNLSSSMSSVSIGNVRCCATPLIGHTRRMRCRLTQREAHRQPLEHETFAWTVTLRLCSSRAQLGTNDSCLDSTRSPTERDGHFFDLNDLNRPSPSQSQTGNYNRSRITQKPNLI